MKPDITALPASAFRSTYDPPDTTLIKSTRPATCAVCRQVVTASIVLPDESVPKIWPPGAQLIRGETKGWYGPESQQIGQEFLARKGWRMVPPEDAQPPRAVCEFCACIALRNMIDDAAACRGSR